MLLSRLFPKFHKLDQHYLFSTKILYFAMGGLYHTFYVFRRDFYIEYLKVTSLNASILQIILNIAAFAGVNIWSTIADSHGIHRSLLTYLCILCAVSFNAMWVLNHYFGESFNMVIGVFCLMFFGLFIGGVMPLTDYHILRRLEEVPHVDSRLYARQVMFGTMSYGAITFVLGYLFDTGFDKTIFFIIIPIVSVASASAVYFMGCPDGVVVLEKEEEPTKMMMVMDEEIDEKNDEKVIPRSPSYLDALSKNGLDTRGTVVHYYHHHNLDYDSKHPNPFFAEDCCPFYCDDDDKDDHRCNTPLKGSKKCPAAAKNGNSHNNNNNDDVVGTDGDITIAISEGEEEEKLKKEKYKRLWKGIKEHKAKIAFVLSCAFTTGIGRQLLNFFLSTHLKDTLKISEGIGNIYLINCISSVVLFWTGPIFLKRIGKRLMLLLGILAMIIRLSVYAFLIDKDSSNKHMKVVGAELFNGLSFVLTHLAGVKEAGDCAPLDWEATFQSAFQCTYVQLPAVITSLGGSLLAAESSLPPIRFAAFFTAVSFVALFFFAMYLNYTEKNVPKRVNDDDLAKEVVKVEE